MRRAGRTADEIMCSSDGDPLSGVAGAGFDGPGRDDAVEDLFGAVPVVIGAAVGAAFFFVVAVGEMGDVAFGRRARGGGGWEFLRHKVQVRQEFA